ncbi:hypothetical protein ABVT39_001505, partial [Epinephelus coioides]
TSGACPTNEESDQSGCGPVVRVACGGGAAAADAVETRGLEASLPPVTAPARPEDSWIITGAKPKVPVLSSTPNRPAHLPLWKDVVRGGKRDSGGGSHSGLEFSNRFRILPAEAPVHPADAPAAPTPFDPTSSLVASGAAAYSVPAVFTPPVAGTDRTAVRSVKGQQNKQLGKSSSYRCWLRREAINRRSGSLPRLQPQKEQPPELNRVPSPQLSPAQPAHPQPVNLPRSGVTEFLLCPSDGAQPASPQPLFSPTTLIIGDSIIRNVLLTLPFASLN